MGRRRKSDPNPLIVLFEMASIFPWWVGVIAAIGFYYLFAHIAALPVPANTGQISDVTSNMTSAVIRGLAAGAKYLIPGTLLVGALASFVSSFQARRLYQGVRTRKLTIADLSWQQFERLIGEVFRQQGYTAVERGGSGGDGGVDLVLRKEGKKYLVQCKHWKSGRVGVSVVRELLGSIVAEAAQGGIVVASDSFTEEATALARSNGIELIGGSKLDGLIDSASYAVPATDAVEDSLVDSMCRPPVTEPSCPRCNADMVLRTARKGPNAGGKFWGCSRFPACRAILNVE